MLMVVDGDKSLVVADKTFVSVAKRNMQGIVPLYYDMKKASPSVLNSETIYDGLSTAFTGSNIGIYSNNISKIWNSREMISGTDKEKEEALLIIKILCMLNNFRIDFAKTLYMPEEPHDIKKRMKNFTNRNVPHFFVYAKDKDDSQVEESTSSLVNKFESLIPSPNITIRYLEDDKAQRLGKPDYRFLMNKPFADTYANEHLVISKYCELLKTYSHKINAITDNCTLSAEILVKSKIKQQVMYQRIMNEVMSELSAFGYSDVEITDILVRYLYCNKYGSDRKDLLWLCYGDIILKNMKLNKSNFDYLKDTQCVDCGEWFYVGKLTRNVCRCNECLIEHNREKRRIITARYRQNKAERMCIPS